MAPDGKGFPHLTIEYVAVDGRPEAPRSHTGEVLTDGVASGPP
ncbi:hypothetical protein USDA257_p02230 (plasmid) [Sinorhizobium fredii USDA 257]|uniref:Uncharacterized protein n=1 Tax=Sinorhizobium fredii (strain USDA 257) TaxID=1185652 RepID=I3XGD2_SINF2|nr:hypothetical protein USDA257_p02230 [Sinorhizobium fredii USDA 257]